MELFNKIMSGTSDIIWTYILIAGLIGLGIYFSIRTKFVQFRYIKEMGRLLTDKNTVSAEGKRGISSFQAFTISTASRVGTGNLAGVATAIAGGGPGAVFWMWLIALLGGATSFIESTLAQIYKVKDGKDGFRGGPAYYMEKGLNARWMGILFAIIITFCFGLVFNSVQSNTISLAMNEAYSFDRLTIGIILAVLTAVIIFGGVKRIASVTQIVVPVMAILYILLALFILILNVTEIPGMIALIFENAFGIREVASGSVGAAIMLGIKRGLFSNEAGMGSAPNAAASAGVTHPAKQGLIQTLGVFTDTLIICTSTAFIIILSNEYMGGTDGIQLTQAALTTHVGAWANTFVAIAIFLFAFSSIIGNYYYGETNIEFIKYSPVALFIYRLAVLGMVIFGAMVDLQVVWDLADLFMGVMAIINLIAITLLGRIAVAALKDYRQQKKEGKDPVFYSDSIEGLKGIESWDPKPKQEKKIN
ncbi:alanine/glycine:cation symporter family protein [Rossellomorea marisflavi]|jgi:alanine or glycine:cation symporter, AGCS family|uniref:Sodium:alanine symporter n=1 Tax=Rossellomorea marisflavi TaxID=189381 RepID=A0A0M0GPW9_9BACI|nr:alanine/glycine:cation symporter family protein [Rossellomorea marisflavi]KON91838.1 sodium:alanine symporter [Rossellomorea marisflavi]MCM2589162.1 alanine:cation symporter family protein [Rossellomorea marisflavi]MDR4936854.1 alanine/glycine:cation symporter family protein [Rossellomorea marisflavi]VXB01626.1 H+/Na+:nitrogen-donor aminoacid symporter [Bacillus sp. 349Y]